MTQPTKYQNVGAIGAGRYNTDNTTQLINGQPAELQLDALGNLNVNVAAITDKPTIGTITTGSSSPTLPQPAGATVTAVTNGLASIGVQITSGSTTWVSAADSIAFEASVDGNYYFAIPATPVTSGSSVLSTTSTGFWTLDTAGYNNVRVRGQLTSGQNWSGSAGIVLLGNQAAEATTTIVQQLNTSLFVSTTGSLGMAVVQQGPTTATLTGTLANTNTANLLLLNANPGRYGATIFNTGAAQAFINFGTTCGTSSSQYALQIPSGSSYSLPQPAYRGIITCAFFAPLNGALMVTEFTQ